MYGYIYMTTFIKTGEVYIGKKALPKFRPTYHGAGKKVRAWRKMYGDQSLVTVMLDSAEDKDELNRLEKLYIRKYIEKCGSDCINEAEGGPGGNVLMYAPDETKEEFKAKMTAINRKRCRTDEFRHKAGERSKKRFSDPNERARQSERVRQAWSDPGLRDRHSRILKEYYKTHTKDGSVNFKPCIMILDGETFKFESTDALKKHLKKAYDVKFSNPALKKMLESEKPYHPFHKSKANLTKLDGMVLKRV